MVTEFIASTLLPRMLAASVQVILVAAVVLLLCQLLPRLGFAARAVLWWLVALQLVVGMAWWSPLSVPLLPAEVLQPTEVSSVSTDALVPVKSKLPHAAGSAPSQTGSAEVAVAGWTWPGFLALAWLTGLGFVLARTLGGYLSTRRLSREALPCQDRSLLHALQLASHAHGLRNAPQLRLSATIDSPQLIGPWKPVLLLPADYQRSMRANELDMALTHELVHLQRADLWWGLLPALAQHLFFFHPIAHLAAREYALAREAACDAAVIAGARHCARDYGRLLLRLGVAPRPSAGLASASPTFRTLKRRLVMLQNTASTPRLLTVAVVGLVAVLGVMPYRITAAPATPPVASAAGAATHVGATAPATRPGGWVAAAPAPVAGVSARYAAAIAPPPPPAPPAVESAPPPPVPSPEEVPVLPGAPAAPAAPSTPAAWPAPPAAPAAPAPPAALKVPGANAAASAGSEGYVMLSGDQTIAVGSSQDMHEAQRQRRGNEPLVWVRKGATRYVIRDPATVERLQALHADMRVLGEQQARIGGRQAALGERQGALGAQQAALGMRQAGMAGRSTRAAPAVEEAQGAMRALDAQQRSLSTQMQALSNQQDVLAREQAALGTRQVAASQRAATATDRLLEQAISRGLAQPVRQ